MGGLCNGKLGEKFNEVFSELMEGDLSKACRFPSMMMVVMMKGDLSQSITLNLAGQLTGSRWMFPPCARPTLSRFPSSAVSSPTSW